MSEYVLCFPRKIVPPVNGVIDFNEELWEEILKNAEFILRQEAEISQDYKQLIPYIYLLNDGKVLSYRRTPKGREQRLHSLCSIGFGGHVNPADNDGDISAIVFKTAVREIREELGLSLEENRFSIRGFLNDDDNPVGFVHYGLVLRVILGSDELKQIKEEDAISSLAFVEIGSNLEGCEYETWSVLLWNYLMEKGV